MPEGFGSTGFTGYGLNHETRPGGQKRSAGGSVNPSLNCEPECGEPIFEWPSDSAIDCGSGGAGATACSISSGGVSCSATCEIGYYACCKSSWGGVSCNCVRQ